MAAAPLRRPKGCIGSGETTPQFVRRFPARRRPRFRGISQYFPASYDRAVAERLEDSWSGDRSKSAWCAALNGCRRRPDQAQSIPPRYERSGNTAESKGEATPTYGSERGTAPASAGGSDPRADRLPRLLGDLELHRPLGLLLHDDRAWGDMTALEHIANVKPHQVAPTQLAVDGEIVTHSRAR